MPSLLRADVYVAPQIPIDKKSSWSPISSTLIHGEKEAVVVDTPLTDGQNADFADWIESTIPGKRLTTIYITHGHGDQFFGISTLQKRFPGARAVATPGTIAHMKQQIEPAFFNGMWNSFFPRQISTPIALADPLPASNEFHLEGHVLRAIEVGHTDTYDSTVLNVPDLNLVVAGDVVYGDVHQYLVEANTAEKRAEWIKAIEKVEALKPETVIAGHKRVGAVDGFYNLTATKKYLMDFGEVLRRSRDAKELFKGMMEKYPHRVNEHALLMGARAAFKDGNKL